MSIVAMNSKTLKEAICHQYNIEERDFEKFVLKRTLFFRVRLIRPLIRFFYPDYLFNERRLVEKIGKTTNLREIQGEVDFYQHKYVVNFVMKEALRFRISGMKIMSLANKAFSTASDTSSPAGN